MQSHEVHLWCVLPDLITDAQRIEAYRDLLSPAELERNERFVFAQSRREHLVTRALVRTTLSRYRPEVDPRIWQFETNPYGRPEVASPRLTLPLRFNVSHASGLIVCLVAAGRDVGVDVEDTSRVQVDTLAIAEQHFAPSEVVDLRSLPEATRHGRFFDYWTLKEAYIKARGLGLQLPLDQFSFQLGPGASIRISFGPLILDEPESWQFALVNPTSRHRLAVAIRRRQEPDLALRTRFTMPGSCGGALEYSAVLGERRATGPYGL